MFNCSNRNLTGLPQDILNDTHWLILTDNNLGELFEPKAYLKEVSHINISSSKITRVSTNITELMTEGKTYFNLRNNSLRNLPEVITNTRNTTELWIAENPYECNCDMIWMRDWLVQATNVMDKENAICASGDMIGKTDNFSNW